MSSLEILALVFAVMVLGKLAALAVSRERWGRLSQGLFKNRAVSMLVFGAAAVVTGGIVFRHLTPVEVAAAGLLFGLVSTLSYLAYAEEMAELADRILRSEGLIRRGWLPIALWTAFSLWVLCSLFVK